MRSALAVAFCLALFAIVAAPRGATATPDQRVIVSAAGTVASVGSFAPAEDPTPAAAVRAYGEPSAVARRSAVACTYRWDTLQISVRFSGARPCARAAARADAIALAGRGWTTNRGVAVGSSVAQLRRRYTARPAGPGRWALAQGQALSATVRDGAVTGFTLATAR